MSLKCVPTPHNMILYSQTQLSPSFTLQSNIGKASSILLAVGGLLQQTQESSTNTCWAMSYSKEHTIPSPLHHAWYLSYFCSSDKHGLDKAIEMWTLHLQFHGIKFPIYIP